MHILKGVIKYADDDTLSYSGPMLNDVIRWFESNGIRLILTSVRL